MQWVLDLGGNFIPGAKAAHGAAIGLQSGLRAADGAAAGLNATMAVSNTTMRGMYADLSKAEAELAHLERTAKRMQASGTVDIGQWRDLQGEIEGARNKVAALNQEIGDKGGRKFDPKEWDDRVKASEKWFAETKKKNEQAEKEATKATAKEAAERTKAEKAETAKRAKEKTAADKENAATGSALWTGTKYAAATAAAAGLAIVGAATVAFSGIVSRALQSQIGAQARLNAIQARYNLGMREISRNANLTPILAALDRGAAMFDKNTATGKFMGEQVKRAFDGIGTVVTALVPYAELAFAKLLVGSVKVETGFYKVVTAGSRIGASVLSWASASETRLGAIRTAAQGVSIALSTISSIVSYISGALGGGVGWAVAAAGIGIMTTQAVAGAAALIKWGAAIVASNPALAAASAAILAVVAAYKQWKELKESWDDNSWQQIKNQFSGDQDAMAKRQGLVSGEDYDKKYGLGKYAKKGEAGAVAKPIGQDIGKGIVVGMKATEAEVAAGGAALTKAAITGAKKEGDIKSPSGKARREIGRELGRGTRLGMADEQDAVQDAAKALIPDFSGGGGGMAGAGRAGKFYHIDLRGAVFNGTQTESDIQTMVDRSIIRAFDRSEESDDLAEVA